MAHEFGDDEFQRAMDAEQETLAKRFAVRAKA